MPWWILPAIATGIKAYSSYKAGSSAKKSAKSIFGLNVQRTERAFDIAQENLAISLSEVLGGIEVGRGVQGRRRGGGSTAALKQDELRKNIIAIERKIAEKDEALAQARIDKKRAVSQAEAQQIASIAGFVGDVSTIGMSMGTGSTAGPGFETGQSVAPLSPGGQISTTPVYGPGLT